MLKNSGKILALGMMLMTASAAVADTYFENGGTLDSSEILKLGLITTEGPGVVEIYDYHRGELGALLGTEELNPGANADVRVPTGVPVKNDVLAVVKINGQIAAEKEFSVE